MFKPRVIPVLLLKGSTLVKSVRFSDYKYIGDPMNAVRIFNESRADEIAFFDIHASREKRTIPLDLVRDIGEQADMPFAVGGGIRSLEDIRAVIGEGAEKVIINTAAVANPDFIREAAGFFGSSTIVACIDVKCTPSGNERVWSCNGSVCSTHTPEDFARLMEANGAGEIIVQSIERDGTMLGYDIDLIARISKAVSIPVICLGGAGRIEDLTRAYDEGHASALAAGSLFVFQGPKRGVLINYPERSDLDFKSK